MTDPNPVHDARMLGADRTAALVAAVLAEASNDGYVPGIPMLAAARRLAEPGPVKPRWPERVWAMFGPSGAFWRVVDDVRKRCSDETAAPARLVPLDGSRVVLDRETAEGLLSHFEHGMGLNDVEWRSTGWCFSVLKAALDAALAEAGR